MKPTFLKAHFSAIALASLLIVVTLPLGYASAQGGQTPTTPPATEGTPGADGGLLIPTNTPEAGGGLLIPTVTPTVGSGLLIPTSTPAPSEPSFPPLSDAQVTAINLQPADVPADFAANQQIEPFTAEGTIAALNDAGAPELAASFQQIADTYGWVQSVGVTYTSCQPNVPINEIYSEVGQFKGTAAGRAFFDDPQVQSSFAALGYALTPAENVHGWRATLGPDQGACFAQETEYSVFLEYWGLLIIVSMTADANTDSALAWNLVDQLVGIVLAHADAQAAQPFAPTPTPGAVALQPTPTLAFQPKPPTSTPVAVKLATLQDIAEAMPTIGDLELQSPPWALDNTTSGTYTLGQVVGEYQAGGLDDLANAVQNAGQQTGVIGQVRRLWSTGLDCTMMVQDLEITVTLFNDSQGAVAYMNDALVQQGWLNTGLFSNIMPHSVGNVMGQLWIGGTTFDPCAPVVYRALIVPHGRFLITVFSIADPDNNLDDLDDANEYVIEYTIERLEGAGLQ